MEKKMTFIKNLIIRFNDDDVMSLAAQLAYNLLSAFFPGLIFLMTLVGVSSIKSIDVLNSLNVLLPVSIYELIEKTVVEVVDNKNTNLLSFSLFLAIWSSASGFGAVIKGLNKAYDEEETRGYFKVLLITILCTIGVVFIIIFTLVLLVFGDMLWKYIQGYFHFSGMYRTIWDIGRHLIAIASLIIVFGCLYLFTPCRRMKFKEIIIGTIFATIGWLIVSICFSYYVNNYSNYSKFYGSIGAVFALMTWLYITSIIILMGGEINATIAFDKK